MSHQEVRRIQDQLRRAIEGGAWHGPALREIIDDMSPAEAAERPLREVHSPWEIALHIVVWLDTVDRRVRGEAVEVTPAEDWPRVPSADDAAWSEARRRLDEAHERLQRTLDGMDDGDLERGVPGRQEDAYFLLHGAVQHTLYHAGQIAILKKAIRSGRRG